MKKKNIKLSLKKQKISNLKTQFIRGGSDRLCPGGGSNDVVCILEKRDKDRALSFDGNCEWSEGTDDLYTRVIAATCPS